MSNRGLMVLGLAGLLAVSTLLAGETKKDCCASKQACQSKVVASGKLRCSLTGTVVDACCCVRREGKLHCTLAKKDVETCCCQPVSKGGEGGGERPAAPGGHGNVPLS